MRLAIVGSKGYWGSKWLRVAVECGHEIVATIDCDGAKAIGSVDADAAIIATPAETHAGIVLAALSTGLDVLVEKPMATSHADAVAMQACAEANGRVLSVDSIFLHTQSFHYLRAMCEPLLSYQSLRIAPPSPHVATPAGWDLIVHDLAILKGFGELCAGIGSQDGPMAQCAVRLSSGGSAFIAASRAWFAKQRDVVLKFPSATYLWDTEGLFRFEDDGMARHRILLEQEETLRRVLADFATRCRERRMEGITDGRHGAEVCRDLERLFPGNQLRPVGSRRVGRRLSGNPAVESLSL